jgi:predicted nucleic acid-binding protein
VASAEKVYVDPSALSRLYVHQAGSREMSEWRSRTRGSLPVTHHGRVEMVNMVALAVFRKELTKKQAEEAWSNLDEDFVTGRLTQVDLLWRGALTRAAALSRAHSIRLGTRSLDVLHVSCALELSLRSFLTFDERQRTLARAVGLKVIEI